LQAAFPGVMRAELEDLLRRFRRSHRHRQRARLATLHWLRVGAVWSLDFAWPPQPIEGRYPRLLSVRDLASGYHLVWRPAPDETGETAAGVLAGLFAEHGPPLVLKSDNGSGFRGGKVKELLAAHGVLALPSPPRTPEYNGSVEAGIGAAKGRTEENAARRGAPGAWTWEDVEAARQQGNVFGQSPIDPGRSPAEVWQAREPLRAQERTALTAVAEQMREEEERAEEVNGPQGEAGQEAPQKDAIWRRVLRRALGALGILLIRWRRISPGVSATNEDRKP
jgi:transposase InsO family protein